LVGKGKTKLMFILFNDIKNLGRYGGVPPPHPLHTGMYIPSNIKGLAGRLNTHDTQGKIPRF